MMFSFNKKEKLIVLVEKYKMMCQTNQNIVYNKGVSVWKLPYFIQTNI